MGMAVFTVNIIHIALYLMNLKIFKEKKLLMIFPDIKFLNIIR